MIGSRGAQYLLELSLGAIRLEKHLVKMPNPPTKEIRNCPFCQMDLKKEELIHVTILCPLAQYVWINIKVALEKTIGRKINLHLEMLYTARNLEKDIDKETWKTIRSFLGEGLAVIMNLHYKRETWINDILIYKMIAFRIRQNRAMKGERLPAENPYEIYEENTAIGLKFLKRRYKKMSQREKQLIEKNLVFSSRNKGMERREGKPVLRDPDRIQIFTEDEESSSNDNMEDTTTQGARQLTIQDFDKETKNRYTRRAINMLEIQGRERARRRAQLEIGKEENE